MHGQRKLAEGDKEEAAPHGVVGGAKVEDGWDQRLDVEDPDGLSMEGLRRGGALGCAGEGVLLGGLGGAVLVGALSSEALGLRRSVVISHSGRSGSGDWRSADGGSRGGNRWGVDDRRSCDRRGADGGPSGGDRLGADGARRERRSARC